MVKGHEPPIMAHECLDIVIKMISQVYYRHNLLIRNRNGILIARARATARKCGPIQIQQKYLLPQKKNFIFHLFFFFWSEINLFSY